jgi:subtilisin family serine protease
MMTPARRIGEHMPDVVCPNCHSLTPPWTHCIDCNAALGGLDNVFQNYPDELIFSERPPRSMPAKVGGEAGVQMDPHLRRACRKTQKNGILKLPTSSTREDEVAVVAKVTDLARFEALEQVRSVVTAVEGSYEDQTALVTARILADEDEIEWVREQEFVTSLKAARRIRPFLETAKRETLACAESLPPDESNGGRGVIIGVVDFGLDFVHRNFRSADEDGGTRILALWDQKSAYEGHPGLKRYRYGRLFEKPEIDEALLAANPYEALGYAVPKDSLFDTGAHGTYVTDVAAGNGLGSRCGGIAPEADIVFVDASTGGTAMQGPQSVGSTFGDSVQLLEAIKFIFDYAKDRPCVINLSLGTGGGPHDGTTPLEEAIDRLVRQRPNRAVVVAAGNSFGQSLHATGHVPEGGCVDLKWRIPSYDSTSNELEVWYSGDDRFTVDVIDPDGKMIARVKPGETWEEVYGGKEVLIVVNRIINPKQKDSSHRDNSINVFFERGLRNGVWTLRLYGESVPSGGRFDAWVERDERGQSRFVEPGDDSYSISNECTLSSIACGDKSIVVSSYNANESDLPLSESSGSGPTRDGRYKPELSAPGEQVLAAQSGTLVLRHRQSGTSISAAVVSGTVALMLAEARARKIDLTADEIRGILIDTARRNPPGAIGWDAGFGYGRVCAKAAVEAVRAHAYRQRSGAEAKARSGGVSAIGATRKTN